MKKDEKHKYIAGYIVGFLIFVVAIPFLIYSISQIFSLTPIFDSAAFRFAISIPLFTFGLAFVIWSNIDLLRIGKGGATDIFNTEISPRTKKLVVTGSYRYTRNPMVLGMNSIYIALAVSLNSWTSLIFCFSFLILVIFYLKMTEEKRLLLDFGDKYRDYMKRVPMIFPFLKRW